MGLLLLSHGVIDQNTLRDAIELQRTHQSGRLGHWLQKLGAVSEQQVTEAVARQWNCGVYPLRADSLDAQTLDLVPYPLLRSLRMLPVHHNLHARTLHIAFCDAVDYSALHVIEQMLEVKTVACIARESEIHSALQRMSALSPSAGQIGKMNYETREMARICRSRFFQADGKDAKALRCGPYIWVRILAKQSVDLLFRNPWISRAEPRSESKDDLKTPE
jgi:type II secretion system (T2SS) protein E